MPTDRTWTGPCRSRDCRHSPSDHLATPELASDGRELVLWCQSCRRHEVRSPVSLGRMFSWLVAS